MCSRADPRRNHGLCAVHRAQRSSGSLFRGGKSPPLPSPAFGGGAQPFSQTEFTAATASSPTARAPRERSYRRGTSRRRLDKQRGWLSKFQIRRTGDLIPVERELPPTLPTFRSTKDLSIPCLATSSFQSFYIYYNSLVM